MATRRADGGGGGVRSGSDGDVGGLAVIEAAYWVCGGVLVAAMLFWLLADDANRGGRR